MNWFSHRIFAVGLAAACKFDLMGIAASYLGSTIPDSIDFFLTKIGFSFNQIHRKHSHAWVWYAFMLCFIYMILFPNAEKYFQEILKYKELCYAFFLGIFSHIFLDMLTTKGVPRLFNPNNKIAVKLVKTNRYSEHVFTFIFFVSICFYLYFTKNQYVAFLINGIYKQFMH